MRLKKHEWRVEEVVCCCFYLMLLSFCLFAVVVVVLFFVVVVSGVLLLLLLFLLFCFGFGLLLLLLFWESGTVQYTIRRVWLLWNQCWYHKNSVTVGTSVDNATCNCSECGNYVAEYRKYRWLTFTETVCLLSQPFPFRQRSSIRNVRLHTFFFQGRISRQFQLLPPTTTWPNTCNFYLRLSENCTEQNYSLQFAWQLWNEKKPELVSPLRSGESSLTAVLCFYDVWRTNFDDTSSARMKGLHSIRLSIGYNPVPGHWWRCAERWM